MNPHPFNTVLRFELRRTLKRPQFWIVAILLPVLIGLFVIFVAWANGSRDASRVAQNTSSITAEYLDASGAISTSVAARLGATPATSADEAIAKVKAGSLDAFISYPANPVTDQTQITAMSRGLVGDQAYSTYASLLFSSSVDAKIGDPNTVAYARGTINSNVQTYSGDQPALGWGGIVLPGLFLVLLILLVIMLGNQMLLATVEEKENKISEMLLVALPAGSLIRGKIVALMIIGLIQVGVFVVPAAIVFLAAPKIFNLPPIDISTFTADPLRVLLGAFLMIGGFLLITSLAVAIGSMMPTAKDAGQYFAVIMVMTFIPFYLITKIVSDPNQVLVQVLTWFPSTAAVTTMARNAVGNIVYWQALLVGVELYLVAAVMLAFGVSTFRRGAIEYDRKLSFKELFSVRRRTPETSS